MLHYTVGAPGGHALPNKARPLNLIYKGSLHTPPQPQRCAQFCIMSSGPLCPTCRLIVQINTAAIQAGMKQASVPPSSARQPSLASSWRFSGASDPMPPIWMPIETMLANPQRA